MITKKRSKIINTNDLLYNINTNIINTENNIEKLINIKTNVDFAYDFLKFDYIFNKFNIQSKIIYTNISKYLTMDKYYLIVNYNIKKNINQQFNYFIIKYENFTTKYSKDFKYKLNEQGILNFNDFFTLIKDSNCVPFWNEKCNKLSKQIFLPIDSNLKITKSPNTFNYNNWFKTEHKIILNNNLDLKLEIDKDKQRKFIKQFNNKKTGKMNNIIKSHKIKIYFNFNQKIYIKRLYGIYRYFYNRTINYINNYSKKTNKTFYLIDCKKSDSIIELNLKDEKMKFSFFTIRRLIKDNYPEWLNEINFPSHLIDMSIKEAISAYDGCMKKFIKYKIPFKLKIKTKKDKIQTMNIENTMIHEKTNSLFYNLKNNNSKEYVFRNLKTSYNLNKYSNISDSSISWNQRINEFYINLNFEDLKLNNEEILKNKKVCSIDPGIKTFLTIYSDDSVHKIGIGIREKIEKICKDIDIIISKQYKKTKGKFRYKYEKRRNLKKALDRKIKYLENLKEELHNKSIKYLSNNYGKIIIPPFETQKMVSNKKVDSRTARNLMNISYYKFLSKLKVRCIEYDIELIIRPEYYTSKTCTKCGNIKHDLKNNDIYICKQCNLKIDRDINGARNILLRNLCN